MKTIITLLTATVLIAGATSAMAFDVQASDEARNNELNWKSSAYSGAYGSARGPAAIGHTTVTVPSMIDRQLEGRD